METSSGIFPLADFVQEENNYNDTNFIKTKYNFGFYSNCIQNMNRTDIQQTTDPYGEIMLLPRIRETIPYGLSQWSIFLLFLSPIKQNIHFV